ncbi:MAG: lamin tail domain-containing protein [Patescibacteria group bacterium]
MKKIIFVISILTTIYFILNTPPIYAQSKILINEFLIDPQPQSVEIFNSGSESSDISDWIIDDSGGTTFYTIPKESIIFPNQCLVFSADFNLNKTSADTIKLINNYQQLIDSFSYKSSSGSGISYQRQPDGTNNWATASANFGFYNSRTEQTCLFPTPTMEPTLTLTPTLTITPIIIPTPTDVQTPNLGVSTTPIVTIPYDNIYLSEVMVNPTTGEKEWVEIYNDNDFSVSLNNWYVDDLENTGSSPKIFSLEINAKSYGVFTLTSSMFNNDGDSVRLLDFNKNLKDDFEYQETEQGKTLGRISFESDYFCIQEPSKNSVNKPCIDPMPISSMCTGQACLTPTISKFQGLINQTPTKNVLQTNKSTSNDVSIHRSTNYPTGIVLKNYNNGDVLGITNELMINSLSNKSFINLLCFLSFSYSLLTICSILFRMKLSYGKNKNFYSPSLHSS